MSGLHTILFSVQVSARDCSELISSLPFAKRTLIDLAFREVFHGMP